MPYKDPEKERVSRLDRVRRYREAHPERVKSSAKRHYDANREEQCRKSREWYWKNRDYANERAKTRNQTKRYGIPESLLEILGSCCGICGAESGNSKGHRLHIDHNHRTNHIRGRLCNRCNRGIGSFEDNPDLLLAAARYLGAKV